LPEPRRRSSRLAQVAQAAGEGSAQRRGALHALEQERVLGYLLIAPAVLYIVLLIGYPFLLALWFAVTEQNLGAAGSAFVGPANFVSAWESSIFQRALRNTLQFTFASEALKLVLGTCLAFLLVGDFPGKRVIRTVIIIPWAIPIAIGVIAWRWMFDSLYSVINWTPIHLGLMEAPGPNWLGDPTLALWSVTFVNVWRGLPFSAIILMAALTSIPQDILDAARVDGCNAFQRYFYIVRPMVMPILFIGLIFSLVFSATDISIVWLLTKGGPINSTHLLATFAFQTGVVSGAVSRGAAISLFLFPVLMVVAVWLLRILKRRDIA
jgi:multiple sugar transport system permease protein